MIRENNINLALLFLMILFLLLGGCTPDGGSSPKSVCKALLTPIEYNSQNPKSQRFAGPALAPDLAKHNRVGISLACPAYRLW